MSKDTIRVKAIDQPKRQLPNLILEVMKNKIDVIITDKGYYIQGFYGLNEEQGRLGWAFAQDSDQDGVMVLFDHRNKPNPIRNFKELVDFHNTTWKTFFKYDEYKRPDSKWFPLMLEYDLLNIRPGQ